MPKNCDTCKYDLFRLCGEEDKTPCDDCYNGNPPTKWEPGENYEPKTNADRIRAMSYEELAEWICGVYDDDYCGCYQCGSGKFINGTIIMDYDEGKILEWLQAPAEGE